MTVVLQYHENLLDAMKDECISVLVTNYIGSDKLPFSCKSVHDF